MSKFSNSQRDRIAAKSHYRCFYCGCDLGKTKCEIDHFLPFSKYRNGTTENLVAACVRCNRLKSDLELDEFRAKIGRLTGTLPKFFFEYHGIVLIGNYSIHTNLLMPELY